MVALVALVLALAGRALAAYEDYPKGWCDRRFGTPTATTGECMCRARCAGPGCQAAQGFIWFKYDDCPTCACVAPDSAARPAAKLIPDHDDDDEIPYGGADDP